MHKRKPEWLKMPIIAGSGIKTVEDILQRYSLNSVCKEAKCPNRSECYSRKTATFIILGTECTRGCQFCNLSRNLPLPPDPNEPSHIARAVSELGLKYVVITSVTRDDLPDGGAEHFAEVVRKTREINPETAIELLIPDFAGETGSLQTVLAENPKVLNHNMETVRRLYSTVRIGADYDRSLNLLKKVKQLSPGTITKSGIILGMGETKPEVEQLLKDLRAVGCDLLTIGQYLAPSSKHFPVVEFISPTHFSKWKSYAVSLGFRGVQSGPMVRSSYSAISLIETLSELV